MCKRVSRMIANLIGEVRDGILDGDDPIGGGPAGEPELLGPHPEPGTIHLFDLREILSSTLRSVPSSPTRSVKSLCFWTTRLPAHSLPAGPSTQAAGAAAIMPRNKSIVAR